MYYILTASADTYITNKIISNNFRATDANVGMASTLDLFKLYDESTFVSGSDNSRVRVTGSVEELSRILVKFDYSPLSSLTGSSMNMNHSSFKARLELNEVVVGAPTPRNFSIVAYPLSRSFSEGVGKDTATFGDVDASNFVTASYSNSGGASLWNMSGSGKGGRMGTTGLDYFTYGTVGSSVIDFGATQYFEKGPGKISVDVTKVVSASLAGVITNHGFRVSFSGSDEFDEKTRFAKRFASRHVQNALLHPRILVTWDNSIDDAHKDVIFNSSASLFLKNTVGGTPQNFKSGSALSELVGQNCMMLRFVSASGETTEQSIYVTASQHTASTSSPNGHPGMKGVYSASFLLNRFDTAFFNTMQNNDEVELKEIWSSLDLTVGYYTGSVTVKKSSSGISSFSKRRIVVTPFGQNSEYKEDSTVNFRLFIEDLDAAAKMKAYKTPYQSDTMIFDKAYYRIREISSGRIVVPFDKKRGSTRLSVDGEGMFVEFDVNGLPIGYTYTVDLLVQDRGTERLIELPSISFKVIS